VQDPAATAAAESNEYDLELYRSLRTESATYNEKLQSLWLQKFTLCGAVAAFMVANFASLADLRIAPPTLVGLGLTMVLAITIDFKVLEYALHTRAISRFVIRVFADKHRAADWERVLWGSEETPERPLVLARSGLTIFSAAMPTLALLAVTTWYVARLGAAPLAVLAGVVVAAGYVAVMLTSTWSVFRHLTRKTPPEE
jgi:hypothetical protein